VPGIVSPGKITVKGAPAVRRLLRNRRPLSSDLARQVLGTYRKDGQGEVALYAPGTPVAVATRTEQLLTIAKTLGEHVFDFFLRKSAKNRRNTAVRAPDTS
jgi:hypothetical protein